MTATDTIRAMLDERGVEWETNDRYADSYTEWRFDGIEGHANATEWTVGGSLIVCVAHPMTPEQAIEATLGRGECRLIPTRDKPRSKAPTLTCSKCGWWTDRINDRINYCPSCGKRVKA